MGLLRSLLSAGIVQCTGAWAKKRQWLSMLRIRRSCDSYRWWVPQTSIVPWSDVFSKCETPRSAKYCVAAFGSHPVHWPGCMRMLSSEAVLDADSEPTLPKYILSELYDRRIPEEIVNEIAENPYLVQKLTKRFSRFEDFAQWMGRWGVRDGADIGRMLIMKPNLLKAKLHNLDDTVVVYRKDLQLRDLEVGRIFVQNPALMLFKVIELKSIFRSFEEVGYARKQFRKFLLEHPGYITPDIQAKLENTVDWITKDMGLKILKAKKAIERAPQILERSRQELNAYVDYFEQHMEMERTRIKSMVRMNPRWLALDLEETIVPTTRHIVLEFGLTYKEVGRIIGMQPGLLVRPIDNLQAARELLMSKGLSHEELQVIMKQAPSAFFVHVDQTLKPLVGFLLDVMKRTPKEIAGFPYCLTYPVEHYMIRVGFLGPHGQQSTHLKQMAKPPDHIFSEIVANSKRTTYEVYKKSWKVPQEWQQYVHAKGREPELEGSDDEDL